MTYVIAGALLFMLVQLWWFSRAVKRLSALPRLEDRVATLAHTVALLTDTTESCFQVVAAQLQGQSTAAGQEALNRTSRQRRVVGAARRGQRPGDIAAQEEVAESEVRLRLHLGREALLGGEEQHGSMRW